MILAAVLVWKNLNIVAYETLKVLKKAFTINTVPTYRMKSVCSTKGTKNN